MYQNTSLKGKIDELYNKSYPSELWEKIQKFPWQKYNLIHNSFFIKYTSKSDNDYI